MNSSSKANIDLSGCADLRWLASVAADLEAANLPHEPILVGALARDVLLKHAHGINTGRATADADFAIAIANWDEYQQVKDRLLIGGAFKPSRTGPHRLEHRALPWIDLIPFGGLESRDRTIEWPPDGDPIMNVMGFQEARVSAIAVRLPADQQVLTVCLPMLAVLKLFAWEDRRDLAGDKDAADLMMILENYLDAGNLARYPGDASEVMGELLDHATAGALLAGRDLGELLAQLGTSPVSVQELLMRILSRELAPDGDGTLAIDMAGTGGDYALILLQALRAGLID